MRQAIHTIIEVEPKSEVSEGGRKGSDGMVEKIAEEEVGDGRGQAISGIVESTVLQMKMSYCSREIVQWAIKTISKLENNQGRRERVDGLPKPRAKWKIHYSSRKIVHWLVELSPKHDMSDRRRENALHSLIKTSSKDEMGGCRGDVMNGRVEVSSKGDLGDGLGEEGGGLVEFSMEDDFDCWGREDCGLGDVLDDFGFVPNKFIIFWDPSEC